MQPVADAIHEIAEENPDDAYINYLSAHGVEFTTELEWVQLDEGDAYQEFFIDPDAPEPVRTLVREFVRDAEPQAKACFANAMDFWATDSRVEYVEGLTGNDVTHSLHKHAWNRVDGYTVDVTRSTGEAVGVSLDESIVEEWYEFAQTNNSYGILVNEDKPPAFIEE